MVEKALFCKLQSFFLWTNIIKTFFGKKVNLLHNVYLLNLYRKCLVEESLYCLRYLSLWLLVHCRSCHSESGFVLDKFGYNRQICVGRLNILNRKITLENPSSSFMISSSQTSTCLIIENLYCSFRILCIAHVLVNLRKQGYLRVLQKIAAF